LGFFSNNNKKIEEFEKNEELKKNLNRIKAEKEEKAGLEESKRELAEAKKKLENKKKRDNEEKQNRIKIIRKREEESLEYKKREEEIRKSQEAENEEKLKERQKEEIAREQRNKIIQDEEENEKEKQNIQEGILNEAKKITEETIKIEKQKETSQKLIKFYKNNILKFKNELKDIERKEKEEITQKKKLAKKIENKERLYDPSIIKSISEDVTLRIFYEPDKKQKAYFNFTDFINRIEIREEEMKKELKIKQNIVKLSMRWTAGDEERVAMGYSGGLMDFPSYDPPGYNLMIMITFNEQYLNKKIASLIKASFPKMAIYDSKFGVSAFFEDQKYEEEYSRRIIQKITQRTCEEFEKLGEVLIEKY